ncbi:hypothetical protein RHMOL_Rhmol10G0243700 [Rhododendron molle]|uniref:Uncharacterized protein n=1 Tax=Rhododendron molle TaxID=49168 RepID=A0ACC0M5E3_RHOML|nr:hypothetical protein RHMOL_Rhmol10G0243700 [Rhododendron molle]
MSNLVNASVIGVAMLVQGTGGDMAHDGRMSALRLGEGLGHLWQLSPIEEDRVVKKQEEEDRVVKKQEEEDDNDDDQEQRESPWMKLPPFEFATWRRLTEKEWKDYNECLDKSKGFDVGDVPDNILDIPVTPLSLDDPETMKDLQMYSIFALKEHNKPEAEDIAGSGSPPLNFRAKVHSLKGRETVEFCEPELDCLIYYRDGQLNGPPPNSSSM